MTWDMPDSITVPDLPNDYLAYLGYADGDWPTAAALRARFPHAKHVILTVFGGTLDADGCDIEPGDLTPAEGAHWALSKLGKEPQSRPVLYCSVSVMPDLIAELGTRGIKRTQVRLLSAHYDNTVGPAQHICGPATCKWPGVPPMDGTQWTSVYPGLNGRGVDMSLLEDSFFGLSWTEYAVQQLPEVRQGNTGEAVKTAQGALVARGYFLGTTGPQHDGIDGSFGPNTAHATELLQRAAGVPVDGVVGPQTWPVLLGIT